MSRAAQERIPKQGGILQILIFFFSLVSRSEADPRDSFLSENTHLGSGVPGSCAGAHGDDPDPGPAGGGHQQQSLHQRCGDTHLLCPAPEGVASTQNGAKSGDFGGGAVSALRWLALRRGCPVWRELTAGRSPVPPPSPVRPSWNPAGQIPAGIPALLASSSDHSAEAHAGTCRRFRWE